ncbi:MAG: HDOD domain-containing protein [Opitutaceae bacterium]|nr:HDOD domain-containing protein [Opitutaceae bacterium]
MSSPVLVSDQELAAAVDKLPPVGSVMQRLLAVLQDADSGIDDVAALVRIDTALATQVLRLANSAYFGLVERVATVEEGIQHIGLTQVQRLVTSLGGRRIFERALDHYVISAPLLWHHTLAVAVGSEVVASRLEADDSIAYLGGILHSIGIVALDNVAAARGIAPRDPAVPLLDWERETFGIDNAAAAERVLHYWKFPESLRRAVADRYIPPPSLAAAKSPAGVLHLACCLAERASAGLAPESGLFRTSAEGLAIAGLTEEQFAALEPELRYQISRTRALLQLA